MVETMEKIKKVLEVIKTLRSENGCMWDRAQTHDSITGELLEESYELIDAINENDNHKIKDELGDVLLQVLMHSQMASEENIFDFMVDCINTVISSIFHKISHKYLFSVAEYLF